MIVVKFSIGQIDLAKGSIKLIVFYKESVTPNILTDAELSERST